MYRIVKLSGHEFYRIQKLVPWFFGHWGRGVWRDVPARTHRAYRSITNRQVVDTWDWGSLRDAQERVERLMNDDNERLARSLGLWRVIWP